MPISSTMLYTLFRDFKSKYFPVQSEIPKCDTIDLTTRVSDIFLESPVQVIPESPAMDFLESPAMDFLESPLPELTVMEFPESVDTNLSNVYTKYFTLSNLLIGGGIALVSGGCIMIYMNRRKIKNMVDQ